jgi:predicted nucleic acid-binding Zn ribbon protein
LAVVSCGNVFVHCLLTTDSVIKDDLMRPDDLEERNLHDDYRRKSIRVPPPKSVRDVLSQLLAKRGYAQIQTAVGCEAAWREAVGAKLAADTRPGNVKRGVLEVLVRNSSALQELGFLKAKIVKSLSKTIPEQKIRDLRFRVGAME